MSMPIYKYCSKCQKNWFTSAWRCPKCQSRLEEDNTVYDKG